MCTYINQTSFHSLISLWLCILGCRASGMFSAVFGTAPSDAMRHEALVPADSITCCKQLPLRSNTCPAGDDACSKAWHGCEKAWQFYSSTQPYSTYRFLWVQDYFKKNANPSWKQISWIFMHQGHQHKLNDAWNTLSWYSSRLAHGTLSICQKLTQCPSHEATKVLLPCRRRNLCQVECIDGIENIPSVAFFAALDSIASSTQKISEKVWPEWGYEMLWVYCWWLGKGNLRKVECKNQKMATLWWTRCGVSVFQNANQTWKFWTWLNNMLKKTHGWLKISNSKEEHQ